MYGLGDPWGSQVCHGRQYPVLGARGLGAGCELRGWDGVHAVLGKRPGMETQERRKAHWSPGTLALWPLEASAKTRLLSTKRLRHSRPPGCRRQEQGQAGLVVRRARRRRTGPGRGQAGGRGGARSPHRACTRAHTLHTHTPGVRPRRGGRGGETKPVS